MNAVSPVVVDGVKIYGRNSCLAVFSVMSLCSFVVLGCSLLLKETYGGTTRFEREIM